MNATETEIADFLVGNIRGETTHSTRGLLIEQYRNFLEACRLRQILELPEVPEVPGDSPAVAWAGAVEGQDREGVVAFHVESVKLRRGPKGRKVQVFGKEEACLHPFEVGEVFDNAAQASSQMRMSYNAVALALKTADAKGEQTATVDGVEFRYLDAVDGNI